MLKKVLWSFAYIALISLVYLYLKDPKAFVSAQKSQNSQEHSVATILAENTPVSAAIGGPFKLVDHTGQTKTDQDFRGKLTFVYFGYTYCPDVCPMALTNMDEALRLLKDKAQEIRVAFITVDPKRDTVPHLKEYMENYGPQFTALTGSESAIRHAMKAYHVYAQKAQGEENSQDYLMDHSSIVYVMSRDGKFLTSFNHQTPALDILKVINKYL